mmetsp:Transcript_18435/g.29103  ORF Transcript_18435/g.29103 Transcript_18435/m.29103 type:complete len:214 (+) Transcript_18435:44-685(+)
MDTLLPEPTMGPVIENTTSGFCGTVAPEVPVLSGGFCGAAPEATTLTGPTVETAIVSDATTGGLCTTVEVTTASGGFCGAAPEVAVLSESVVEASSACTAIVEGMSLCGAQEIAVVLGSTGAANGSGATAMSFASVEGTVLVTETTTLMGGNMLAGTGGTLWGMGALSTAMAPLAVMAAGGALVVGACAFICNALPEPRSRRSRNNARKKNLR